MMRAEFSTYPLPGNAKQRLKLILHSPGPESVVEKLINSLKNGAGTHIIQLPALSKGIYFVVAASKNTGIKKAFLSELMKDSGIILQLPH